MRSISKFSDIFRAVIFASLVFVIYEYNVGGGPQAEKPRYVVSEDRK